LPGFERSGTGALETIHELLASFERNSAPKAQNDKGWTVVACGTLEGAMTVSSRKRASDYAA